MDFTKENTLAEIVNRNLNASNIFDNYRLNYSTEGKSRIGDACITKGLNAEVILNKLKKTENSGYNKLKISEWETGLLCDFIINNHHTYIRKNLPKLITVSINLIKENKCDELIHEKLFQLKNEFEIHMQKEEKLIFPYIMRMKKIANDREKYVTPPFGSVASPVKVMEKEHRNAYTELIIISKLIRSMITKNNNDASIRSLNEKFTEFISDFNFHIHLENNILFPKAIRLESKLKKQILKNKK